MTRSSPAWKWIGFAVALVGVGFKYWQMPHAQASHLPDALLGPGLVAVGVVAMLLRAFGTARFWKVWLLAAAAVPAAVLVRMFTDTQHTANMHHSGLSELAVATGLGLAAALLGTAIGSLFLLRSSQRPG